MVAPYRAITLGACAPINPLRSHPSGLARASVAAYSRGRSSCLGQDLSGDPALRLLHHVPTCEARLLTVRGKAEKAAGWPSRTPSSPSGAPPKYPVPAPAAALAFASAMPTLLAAGS